MKSHTLAKMLLEMPDCDVILPWMHEMDDDALEDVEFRDGSVYFTNYGPCDNHIETFEEHRQILENRKIARSALEIYSSILYPASPRTEFRVIGLTVPEGY